MRKSAICSVTAKTVFRSALSAQHAIRDRRGNAALIVVACPHCRGWHIEEPLAKRTDVRHDENDSSCS